MKILAYDDNPDFGGHQMMACHGIAALAADPAVEVVCMLNPANRQLAEKLAGLEMLEAPCTPQQLKSLNPDLVLCIQGDIAQSARGAAAARKAGIESVSYLALPHTLQQMGAKLGALRDRTNQKLINQPTRYIVISESMKNILRERGVTKPITIVPNGIPPPPAPRSPRQERQAVLGLLGRVEFNQKKQDFMVRTFLGFPEVFTDCHLLMAGDGPDADKLRALAAGKKNITLIPWQSDADAFYNQIDFLMLPSRFEGVPLVMLEALVRGIPVLGSNRDGMRDILPEAWTFEAEDGAALARTFSRIRNTWPNEIEAIKERVATDASLDTFKANFLHAVL